MACVLALRCLENLRAIASTPGGLRLGAYRSALPLLADMGLMIEPPLARSTHSLERAWFLTPEGRETVRAYGEDEP